MNCIHCKRVEEEKNKAADELELVPVLYEEVVVKVDDRSLCLHAPYDSSDEDEHDKEAYDPNDDWRNNPMGVTP